jgi:hypothetical protein
MVIKQPERPTNAFFPDKTIQLEVLDAF